MTISKTELLSIASRAKALQENIKNQNELNQDDKLNMEKIIGEIDFILNHLLMIMASKKEYIVRIIRLVNKNYYISQSIKFFEKLSRE